MRTRQEVIKERVRHLVEKEPQTAANRNLLIVRYWMRYDGVKALEDSLGATAAESITRAFRALKNEGDIALSGSEHQALSELEGEYKKAYGSRMQQGYIDFTAGE